MVGPLTIEYVAGFFDGEGSICIGRRGPRDKRALQLHVSLTQANLVILQEIASFLGAKHVLKEKDHGSTTRETLKKLAYNTKPCFEIVWTSQQAENVLRLLTPHLRVKREEAEIALAFRETFVKSWNRRPSPVERQRILDQREGYRSQLRVVRGKEERS